MICKPSLGQKLYALERKTGSQTIESEVRSVGYMVDGKKGTLTIFAGADAVLIPKGKIDTIITELQGISECFFNSGKKQEAERMNHKKEAAVKLQQLINGNFGEKDACVEISYVSSFPKTDTSLLMENK